jgi:hypothetical protein
MNEAIVSASVSGNTLTLKNVKGDSVTFNKAVTLSGAWSNGTVTVSAGGNSWYSTLKSLAAGDISWSGNTASFTVMAYNNGSESPISTGRSMSLDASARYTAGYNQGLSDKSVSGYTIVSESTPYWSNGYLFINVGVQADYNTGGAYFAAPAVDVTPAYNVGVASVADPTSIGIYDINGRAVADQTIPRGHSVELWGGCSFKGSMKWGSKLTLTAQGNPSYNYSMYCVSVTNEGGVLTNTFRTTGGGFSAGSSYGFWRA